MTRVEQQPPTLQAHLVRTAALAERIATTTGSDPTVAASAALLHEGGSLPPYDLAAPTEWLSRAAAAALRADSRRAVADAVRFHRERADGAGPFGLTHRRIPVAAAIVGLVHAYDVIVDGQPEMAAAAVELLARRASFPARLIDALVIAELSQ